MTTYSDVFGGANIYPAEISYRAISLTANVTLNWPTEAAASGNFTARIMDVTEDQAGRVIKLPPANEAGVGETILFIARMPPHVCLNEIHISPLWNRGYIGSPDFTVPRDD